MLRCPKRSRLALGRSWSWTPRTCSLLSALPALRERVWRQNELVAYTDDFLFQTRAERLARVHEAEDRVKVNHGLLRRDFAILTSAWALPKIINIARAMAEGHARKDEGARRMSVFELEKLEKGKV